VVSILDLHVGGSGFESQWGSVKVSDGICKKLLCML